MLFNLFGRNPSKKSPAKKRPDVFRKHLQLEKLENREVMAASLTATLAAGVLTVEGTDRNDAIVLRQVKDRIALDGMRTTFAARDVRSIVVNSLGGRDTINVLPLNVGRTVYAGTITINAGVGADQVNGGAGRSGTVVANGQATITNRGITLTPPAPPPSSGDSSPAPAPAPTSTPTWADANITDAALRSYLNQSLSDKVLNRSEVVGMFNVVKTDGKVSAGEFEDLKKVANNRTLFATGDGGEYVFVITRDVVLGNAANAKFGTTTLGNLAANSSGAHLDKLVSKWFYGGDRPLAQVGTTTFSYTVVNGQLFGSNGPQYSDVRQGSVGDCYYVGALAEIAYRDQNAIRNMFIVNGDGTYGVRFYNNGKADFVTVDSMLPVTSTGRLVFANMGARATDSNVLWVALAEKAYVQMNASGWLRVGMSGNGVNSYQAIAGGLMSHVTKQVVNVTTTNYQLTTSLSSFVTAFNAGKMIGFATKTSGTAANLVGGHQYVVVGYDAATQKVTLFNPWGINNGSTKPGLVTLSWAQIQANCMYWSVSA